MASYSTLIVSLFLLITSSYQFSVAKADDALIQKLCSKTQEPVICEDCFSRNPTSKTADGKGLALISLKCGEYDAELLFNFTFNLWESTPESETELKQILDSCSSQMLVGHDSFRGAAVAIEEGSYNWRGYAIEQINTQVSPFLNRCLDLFNQHPQMPLPPYILAGTNAVNQDISVILGILKSI